VDPLDAIFSPESVAVIGASGTPGKVGHDIFVNILRGGYRGTLYPVNPNAHSIACVKSYPAITEIPDSIDLAIAWNCSAKRPRASVTSCNAACTGT